MTAATPGLFSLALPHGITLACRGVGPRMQPLPGPQPGTPPDTDLGTHPDTPAGAALRPPRVLLLHGFPEGAFAWDEVLGLLAAQRPTVAAVAPSLRGFAGSSAPVAVSAYRARLLVADLVAAIEALGGPLDLLVAHDWGGALAWSLAAQRPDLMRQLLIVNAPHPATFLRELRGNPQQQQASAYMNWLCRPDAAARLAADDFARLWGFFGPAPWLTAARRDVYRQAWRQGLHGALNYYRASPLRPPLPGDAASAAALQALHLADEAVTVRVPTTVLWGERDHALLPCLLDGLAHWVPNLRVQREPAASHWLVHEQPQTVVQAILRLL